MLCLDTVSCRQNALFRYPQIYSAGIAVAAARAGVSGDQLAHSGQRQRRECMSTTTRIEMRPVSSKGSLRGVSRLRDLPPFLIFCELSEETTFDRPRWKPSDLLPFALCKSVASVMPTTI